MNIKTILNFLFISVLSFSLNAQDKLIDFELLDSYDEVELLALRVELGIPEFFISIDHEVDVYRVTYNTPDPKGNMTFATGAVCIPKDQGCALPLCSYQHGTVAHKMGVPSYQSGELDLGIMLATSGYILALPDYLGLGDSPGLHPYVHADSEGTACLDLLRAVREMSSTLNFRMNDQLMLLGYSQGGHATMALHREIEKNAADEFKVDLSVPMSGPYDISGTQAQYLIRDEPYPTPGYLPYTIMAYQEVYGNLYNDISEVLKPPYDKTIPPLFDGNNTMGFINSQCTAIPNQMLQDSTLENFKADPNHRLRKALEANDLYDWFPKAPIHMLYCEGDDQVDFMNALVALEAFEGNGLTDIFAQNMGDGDHGECVTPALFRCKTLMDETRKISLGITLNSTISDEAGSIQLEIQGGNPPFTFDWSNGEGTQDLENLASGNYTLTISDVFGCQETFDFKIEGSTAINGVENYQELTIVPNPSHGSAQVTLPHGNNKADVEIFNAQGQKVESFHNQGDQILLPKMETPGIYFVKVSSDQVYFTRWISI